ncbi:MAG: hypothetical protein C4575_01970 [Desulforudis sp.]|nr:MAG: hypothetical protein C4575_01970 [Desulforudis sp.]
MGTKLQSLVLWVFFIGLLFALAFSIKIMFWVLVLLALLLFKGWIFNLPRAKKKSKEMGLQTVVLIPISYHWASLLLWISGKDIGTHPTRAYEVHIARTKGLSREDLWYQVSQDLLTIKEHIPGLFLWETSAPIPCPIRLELRKAKKNGIGFWDKGGYPIPRFPGTEMELRRKRHYGAVFHSLKAPKNNTLNPKLQS